MAEDRPSVNHLIRTGLCQPLGVDQRLVTNESVDGHGVSQQNKSLKLNQRVEVCKINLSTSRSNMKSSELDSQSSSLLPDVRHINGFYTIADTLHKENANSAVTVTTQSQMGEVRMSSRVAEPLSLKHGLVVHSEWDQKNFNNDLNVQGQTKQAVESNAFSNPLKEITDCVEHITLLDDDDLNGNVEMSGNLELQEMSQFGNDTSLCLSVDTESLLPSHGNKQSIDQTRTERALDTEKKKEEIPENISEFVLGHDQGKSHLAMQVPLDDSDLDRILPAGFENAIELVRYQSELQMPDIMKLITKDLSEPYSIYTYRYFIHNWPSLCFLVSTIFRWLKVISDADSVLMHR
ncbi:hypothetical protein BSL78_15957 [Apostichopus japonicus]|uniref:Uncharacterized protein n=1 Tax=Stichopus japonicus TaxID=307972 RepID=A0A2G8KGR2_STIJA|nr:hypothetical protein BSL78_15957 [Apostichopus japonicus]